MELPDYKSYIEKNNFTNSEKSGYFVSWVKRFLRLEFSELTRMRVMNVDFDNCHIAIKDAKGGKDRVVSLSKKPDGIFSTQ